MTILDKLLGKSNDDDPTPEQIQEAQAHLDPPRQERERVIGRIIKLGEGWGFISTKEIPYTRIFFHWSALQQDTLRFPDLTKGMFVEFEPLEIEGRGIRAIRLRVLEQDK